MYTTLHLTLAEYEKMVDQGAFAPLGDRRIELIRGELREMSPQGVPHVQAITYLNRWSIEQTDKAEVAVIVQGPIRFPALESEPEPDIAWVAAERDITRLPEPAEVLLLIEVANSTLTQDLTEKAALYAEAGILDYWVVDLQDRVVHLFRQPTAAGYAQQQTVSAGEIRLLRFPDVTLRLDELFARIP